MLPHSTTEPAPREIPLTQGRVAIVDAADYDDLVRYRWCYDRGYAVRSVMRQGRKHSIRMHRVISAAPPGVQVDHRDGNGCNNTRSNLRLATNAQNVQNRPKARGARSSRFKGVYWDSRARRWRAQIQLAGRRIHLGLYDDEQQAARAYDAAAAELFGAFVWPNSRPAGRQAPEEIIAVIEEYEHLEVRVGQRGEEATQRGAIVAADGCGSGGR